MTEEEMVQNKFRVRAEMETERIISEGKSGMAEGAQEVQKLRLLLEEKDKEINRLKRDSTSRDTMVLGSLRDIQRRRIASEILIQRHVLESEASSESLRISNSELTEMLDIIRQFSKMPIIKLTSTPAIGLNDEGLDSFFGNVSQTGPELRLNSVESCNGSVNLQGSYNLEGTLAKTPLTPLPPAAVEGKRRESTIAGDNEHHLINIQQTRDLASYVFWHWDADSDGVWNEDETRLFGDHAGWDEPWTVICAELGISDKCGITPYHFMHLCYLSEVGRGKWTESLNDLYIDARSKSEGLGFTDLVKEYRVLSIFKEWDSEKSGHWSHDDAIKCQRVTQPGEQLPTEEMWADICEAMGAGPLGPRVTHLAAMYADPIQLERDYSLTGMSKKVLRCAKTGVSFKGS